MNVKRMCRIGVAAAMICAVAPWSLPVGPIPISLATLAVSMAGAVMGMDGGVLATAIYLLLGAVGVPVFSGFGGGAQRLVSATGGYLWGYLLLGAAAGVAAKMDWGAWRTAAVLAVGTILLYAVGTVWFIGQTQTPVASALGLCVLPFLPGDAVKIAVTAAVAPRIRRGLK